MKGAFRKIAKEDSKEEFVSLYGRYVENPEDLKRKDPQTYEFFRDRVFNGRENGVSGIEKFMRDTAPNRTERTMERTFVDIYPNGGVLPRTEVFHSDVINCENPISYGDANEMAEKMDYIQEDTSMLPIAPARMVACRNIMALCGKKFTQDDVTKHVVDIEMMPYDPLALEGFSNGENELIIPTIIRRMSGIEVYRPDLAESGDPVESLASLLDHGHRGMVVYNPTLLNRSDVDATTPIEKLLDKLPRSANETSTLLCAVRDGNTGKPAGFIICDSTKNEATRYVEAERLMKAMDVKNGMVLFTRDSYLDK